MISEKLGPYRVVEQVGEGGMGAVYRAVDEMLERDVAIKVLRPALAHDEALVERFRQEARSLARIVHPNVAALYGLFDERGTLFMAMEFVPGETADAMLRRRGRLPWAEACAFVSDVLGGLDAAHRLGIIHRDLKPANLLVSSSGAVKITDFGIARVLGTARRTRTGAIVGTLAYMAPEQVRGEEGDERTDVYAAGMVLYELLTGAVAFPRTSEYDLMRAVVEEPARPPRETLPDAPAWLDAIVVRALAKDPAERFQSAAEMLAALGEHRELLETEAPAQTRVAPAAAFVPATRLAVPPAAVTARASRARRVTRRGGAIAAVLTLVASLSGWAAWRPSAPAPTARRAAPSAASGRVEPALLATEQPPPVEDPAPDRPVPPRRTPVAPIEPKPIDPPVERPAPPAAPPRSLPPAEAAAPAPEMNAPLANPSPAPASDVVFDRVKMLRTIGGKTEEVDVLLTFTGTRLVIADRKRGEAMRAMSYRALDSAVYAQSKHPRWKEGSAAAVAVGVFAAPVFFMKGTKHWLTLEGADVAIVLRLDKRNYQAILPELEVRTGRRITGKW